MVQRNFSTRGRPGSSPGEVFFPGFPGYAGGNLIRLPEGSYTGDPGPLWRRTARGRFKKEVILVQSAPAGTDHPEAELTELEKPAATAFGIPAQTGAPESLPPEPVETGEFRSGAGVEEETGAKNESQQEIASGHEFVVTPEVTPGGEAVPEAEVIPGPEIVCRPEAAPEPEIGSGQVDAPGPEVVLQPENAPEPEVTPEPEIVPGPEVTPGPAPEPKPQREPERKPLIWKAFPE